MTQGRFTKNLLDEIEKSLSNNFGKDNFDEHRFGRYPIISQKGNNLKKTFVNKLKDVLRPYVKNYRKIFANHKIIRSYSENLEIIYQNLNERDRQLLISIVAYRILGYRKIKLPRNNAEYWDALDLANTLKDSKDTLNPNFMHFILERFNLIEINYDIDFYYTDLGVAIDFLIEQYAYKNRSEYVVVAEEGDVVFDLGGCWGDTALYFSHKVGKSGKVYSFEFIPANINLFNKNIGLNPTLKDRITLIPQAVSTVSDQTVYFKDDGPGSVISSKPFENQTGSLSTISIDDFVERNNITKVDYIKMDIEGAELLALKGAVNTIKKFKPKLAIAIYHSIDDFVSIPNWLFALGVNYDYFLDHFTIHSEETIFFAKPK